MPSIKAEKSKWEAYTVGSYYISIHLMNPFTILAGMNNLHFVCDMCLHLTMLAWISLCPSDPHNFPLRTFSLLAKEIEETEICLYSAVPNGTIITILGSIPKTVIYFKFLLIVYLILMIFICILI
jgi:hypothetical protein